MNILGKFPLVRVKQIRDNPGYFFYFVVRLFRYKYTSHRYILKYREYVFLTPQETLAYLMEKNVSLARFNDGEIGMLTGAGIYPPDSDWSQRYSRSLRTSLLTVLASDRNNLLVALPPPHVFLATKEEARERGVLYTMWTDARRLLWRFTHAGHVYGDANVFIPSHHADFDWERFHSYIRDRDVVIVTGGTSALYDVSLGRRMFFVEAGKHDAYERYARIVQDFKALTVAEDLKKESTIVLASLGTTADILAYDLSGEGWQVWDTGHFFRYADRQSFVGEKKVFTKQMHNRTPNDIKRIFDKCTELHTASLEVEKVIVPKPLSYTATTIVFERLTLPQLLSEVLYAGNWEVEPFERMGHVLGALHKHTKHPDGTVLIHGDLWAHNIAFKEGILYLFDSDAPALAESIDEYIRTSPYVDIAAFIVSVCVSSSFKHPWTVLATKKEYVERFLRAYEITSGMTIDFRSLHTFITRELSRWKAWQIAYGHSRVLVELKYLLARFAVSQSLPNRLP